MPSSRTAETAGEKTRDPNYMASPYEPLDSWIYPALERLIALGYVKSAMLGMRPWTRMECARLLENAEDKFPDDGVAEGEAGKLYATLISEFETEVARLDGAGNLGARVNSVYTRSTGISGTPLRDAYHFGQTIINDYGRPYWTGFNEITGLSADAEAGPISFYFRGEYQHAPAMPSYPTQFWQQLHPPILSRRLPMERPPSIGFDSWTAWFRSTSTILRSLLETRASG